MPQYLAPGVYVEEVDTGIKTIEGVSTSVAGMVGVTRRGPTRGQPQLVTSFAEYERIFGGFDPLGGALNILPHAVSGFFTNGGRQLYVMRVANGVTPAKKTSKAGVVTRLLTKVDNGDTTFKPASVFGIEAGTKIRLRMVENGTVFTTDFTPTHQPTVTSIDAAGIVTVSPALKWTGGPPQFDTARTAVFTDRKDPGAPLGTDPIVPTSRNSSLVFEAKEPGSWGRDIAVTITPEPAPRVEVASANTTTDTLTLKAHVPGFYNGAWIEIDRGLHKLLRKVTNVNDTGTATVLTVTPALGTVTLEGSATALFITVWEAKLTVSWGSVVEEYPGIVLEPNVTGKSIGPRLANSSLITVASAPASTDPLQYPIADDGRTFRLDDAGQGTDGNTPSTTDYVGGGDPGDRFGLKALEDIDRISIIAAPGNVDVPVQAALIGQCETLKDRFAILDPAGTTVNHVTAQRQQFDTKYAAIYFPNLRVFDPVSGSEITVPPSGHMAGLYARVDIERGVHKAPANEVVRGITNFALTVNKETHDLLNPSPTNINVFRDFRADGRGLRIWGARVMTSDTAWKYINVRRLFLFIEESIDEGTQWVVFEPNDEPLWARVRQSITAFLTRVWRDGALQGATPEEAFFVKCDRTTMTQDDLDNGKLICLVGVAPVKPAEFVIIRISQFTASAEA